MKYKLLFFILFAVCIVLAGCSNTDIGNEVENQTISDQSSAVLCLYENGASPYTIIRQDKKVISSLPLLLCCSVLSETLSVLK